MGSRYRLFDDAQWERVSSSLPSNAGRRGHPVGDDRRVVEGIVYRYRTGIPWRDLPRSEFGPWQTVWKRHRRYAADGTWNRVLADLLAEAECEPAGHGIGRSRGGVTTKIYAAVDGRGRPLAVIITGGQRSDGAMLAAVLDGITVPRRGGGRPGTRPDAVIADRAYSSGVTWCMLRARGITAVIPQKRDEIAARARRGRLGGRPPRLDQQIYKGRDVVERSFALLKQWRGLATRYDKLAITYRAAVVLSACITWLRNMGDTA